MITDTENLVVIPIKSVLNVVELKDNKIWKKSIYM